MSVTDSGRGIPEEHLPYIFDRFYKASASNGIASPGSGLGLAIVKAIAHRHGGRAYATSRQGVGTTVSIEIPIRQASASPAASDAALDGLEDSGTQDTAAFVSVK